MSKNVGGKIKTLAMSMGTLGIIACVIAGALLISEEGVVIGLLVSIGGVLVVGINSFLIYGFGELVENSVMLVMQIKRIEEKTETDTAKLKAAADRVSERYAQKQTMGADEWKCPVCGRVNRKYVTTCVCGKNQHTM